MKDDNISNSTIIYLHIFCQRNGQMDESKTQASKQDFSTFFSVKSMWSKVPSKTPENLLHKMVKRKIDEYQIPKSVISYLLFG